jgi:sigma-B regulation protein RsbU (phosphoserine phosphatase)
VRDDAEVVDRIDDAFYGALVEDDAEDLYDHAPCAYLSTLPDGTIVKVNATFLTWTGFERSELIGRRRFQELLAPGDRIFHETHYSPQLRMQGQVREIAVEIVDHAGQRLPVLVNSVLKRDAEGNPLVIRTAVFDATERRSYERELLAARRRAEESEVRATALARTLQSTFLPHEIPAVPGVDVAGVYRPAGDGSEVGGDFYDVFETGRGSWGIVLGDVCGKGAGAAVLTSLARYTVRAEALRTPAPDRVLGRLHEAFLRYHPEQFCTAVLLFLSADRGDGGAVTKVALSSGGHHLPLRVRADGSLDTIGRTGSLIGLLPEADLPADTVELAPGDVLVLYTDGVTEGRHDLEFFDDERLHDTVRSAVTAGNDAAGVAEAVVATAVDFQDGVPRDDIAVVVVRVLARP